MMEEHNQHPTFLHSIRGQLILVTLALILFVLLFGAHTLNQMQRTAILRGEITELTQEFSRLFSLLHVNILNQERTILGSQEKLMTPESAASDLQILRQEEADLFISITEKEQKLQHSPIIGKNDPVFVRNIGDTMSALSTDYALLVANSDRLTELKESASDETTRLILSDIRLLSNRLQDRAVFAEGEFAQMYERYSAVLETEEDRLVLIRAGLFLPLIALTLFAIIRIIRRARFSLNAIFKGIEQFRHGDFSHPIVINTQDEFGMIARSLNNTLASIEQSILESRRLANIIETSFEGIVTTDKLGVIEYVNPAWEKMTGWKKDEVVGRVTPRILKSGKHNEKFYQTMWKTVEGGKIFHSQFTNRRKDGTLMDVEEVIMPLLGNQGSISGFAGFQRDISEQRRTDQALRNLNESRDAFIRNTTHGLRTPMSAIGYTFELFMDKIQDLPLWTHQFLIGAREHYDAMREILENFIFIQELSPDYFKRPNVSVQPREELEIITTKARWYAGSKNVIFRWDKKTLPDALPLDRVAFAFVMKQLFDNAVIYTASRGKITFFTFQQGDRAVFQIVDTGIGIPTADQSKVFEPFYRAPNAFTQKNVGVGIGLYLVKVIVEGYGGKIYFDSDENKGSTFTVELPLERTVE